MMNIRMRDLENKDQRDGVYVYDPENGYIRKVEPKLDQKCKHEVIVGPSYKAISRKLGDHK